MLWYTIKRLLLTIPQALFVTVAVFILLRVMPVDAVAKFVGLYASPEAYALTERKLGLDQPLLSQLWTYLTQLVSGDFGTSWITGKEVWSEIAVRFPVTVQLMVLAFILALVIGVPAGIAVATKPGGLVDKFVGGYSLFAGSQPEFFWGLLFIFLFYFRLSWAPAPLGILGITSVQPEPVTNFILIDCILAGQFDTLFDVLHHLALPVITLSFILVGPIIKMVRQTTGDVLASDWVVYARAAGVPQGVIERQTLRVSLAPVLTIVGVLFAYNLGGALIIEQIFSLEGLGVYALQRTLQGDFPAIQGAVFVMTIFALIVFVSMDLMHAFLDPRVREQTGS